MEGPWTTLRSHKDDGSLPAEQHGYRQFHSCETALAHILSTVGAARNRGETTLVASFDASGAFDCLSHDILLQKLERSAGVRGAALRLIASFLANPLASG